jgi:glycosyltransferase involved in cell wall biosynthesis
MGIKTILRPIKSQNNVYIHIVKRLLEENGYEVCPLNKLSTYLSFNKARIVNLNWYENYYYDSKMANMLQYLKKHLVVILVKRLFGMKIIVTIHNKISHENKNRELAEKTLLWLIKESDVVIHLCQESLSYFDEKMNKRYNISIKEKSHVLYHPNYIGEYPDSDIIEFEKLFGKRNDKTMELLYIGNISRYKNIEILVEAAKRLHDLDIHFSIAGGGDQEYLNEIQMMVEKLDNIDIKPGYISDESIIGVVKGADCIVLPYQVDSMLNSASVILAISVGTTVVCPAIGTTLDMPDEFVYSYEYSDNNEHVVRLCEQISRAYNDFVNRGEWFIKRREKIINYAEVFLSQDGLRDKYKEIYEDLLSS